MPRIAYFDNLKALAIILVVTVHAAITYSAIGEWFYIEHDIIDNATYDFFLFWQSFCQAFFMSLLFMIGGYFVPGSLSKKGVAKFLQSRTFRLGLPALIFAVVIYPICAALTQPSFTLTKYVQGLITFRFIRWIGPLWFTIALLFFSLIYIVFKRGFDRLAEKCSFTINFKNVSLLILMIGLVSFAIRLAFPIGTSLLTFQICFFSAYFFLFMMGVFAKQKNLLDQLTYRMGIKTLLISFGIGVPWWLLTMIYGLSYKGIATELTPLTGGWNWPSLSYAFWEGFFCVTFIIALLGIFKARFNEQNRLQKFLSTNSFGVYVFHSPILIITAMLFKNIEMAAIVKYLVVISIVLPTTFILTHYLRKIPVIRKIFS